MKHHLVGPIEEAKSVSVPFLEKGADLPLTTRGCTFVKGEKKWNSYIMISYPPGSKRQELSPRTHESRFLVTFPDGFEVLEVMDRNGICKGLSLDLPTGEA
jgi:hypothetical protein